MPWSADLSAPTPPPVSPWGPPPPNGPVSPNPNPYPPGPHGATPPRGPVIEWPAVPPPAAPADRRALVAIGVIAVAVAVALRTRLDGSAGAVLVVVLVGALLASRRLRNPQAVAVAALAIPFGTFLALRTSAWLIPLDLAVVAGLLGAAAGFAPGGSVFDSRPLDSCRRAAVGVWTAVTAPAFLVAAASATASTAQGPGDGSRRHRRLAVVRGLGIGIPIVVVLGVLLGSGDAVFRSLFHVPVDGDTIWVNGLLVVVGAWVGAALVGWSSQQAPRPEPAAGRPLGAVEAAVVLGGLIALFTTFAVTQVVTALGGADHVLQTAGLTRAEYARAGFFQLLAVAALTLLVLCGVQSLVRRPSGRRGRVVLAALGELTVALTLVIVAVALARLRLYDDAYGLTMLRLFCTAFAWWLGALFVLLGVALGGVARSRHWLTAAVVLSGLATVFALNAVDPEADVVRHNVERIATTSNVAFDPQYTGTLSDDAVPALAEALPALAPGDRASVLDQICRPSSTRATRRPEPAPEPGALGWNRAAAAAAARRLELCR